MKANFLTAIAYSNWVANFVPGLKKEGKVRMCVDYRDLNWANPKNNQIKMAEEDKANIAFTTHWGTYAYDVMPFDLKNASATYQRAMVTLFHDMMHKEIEVYVDDMIAKSRTTRDHLVDLTKLFKCLVKYRLRLNLNKCLFEASLGKLLVFIVSQRGIEVDLAKVQAI